ncbi:protein-methionine-sulfoxide reductase heme-binding subunit MsrQ [Maricaulis sp.]|uniref:sulfite oxidase heme-binding subunit YedZ n=1 Tax=Maricaulis sp. TaxID=1486257 RepID=UPI0026281805|nr:protein-methionine-sulfoxide reductase heme-binding subunit MsrQ [Maricaulis sp.]
MPRTRSHLARFERQGLKPLAFWLLALPGLWLFAQWGLLLGGQDHSLGFNPIETTHRFLGDTALYVLMASLAVTPLRDLTRWKAVMKIRRRIGLAAFWYAVLHVIAYLGLDLYIAAGMSVSGMMAGLWDDVVERTYITLGMLAFIGLIPLALTSFNAMIRRLGALLWRRLHLAVYPISVLAVLHYGFLAKGNQLGPWIHGAALAALLGYRLFAYLRHTRLRAQHPA